jgi:hypothetical protein
MSSRRLYTFSLLTLWLASACASSAPNPGTLAQPNSDVATLRPLLGETLVISADQRLEPGDYLHPAQGEDGALLLEGLRGVTLDLRGVVLRGTSDNSSPHAGRGLGLVLRKCEDVEILGGTFGGYRVAVSIEDCDDVRLRDTRVEPNFGTRLVGSDVLSHADDGLAVATTAAVRWLEEYGAAIAVVDSSRVEVRGARARGGQNGLVALRSEGCRFIENDFSYLSGWGIALAGCHETLVAANSCDVVTRRGYQGSTESDHGASGILITAGSSDNVVAGNSARGCTAGGRELFAAGEEGQRNRWIANDLSESGCVALDIAGARDSWYVANRIHGGQGVGLRARGAQHLALVENDIEGILGAGIALEGGHRSVVHRNRVADCDRGLDLQPGGLVAEEVRDFRVTDNRFEGNIQDLVLERVAGLELAGNEFDANAPSAHLDGLTLEGASDLSAHEVWSGLADGQGHLPSGRSANSCVRLATSDSPRVLQRIEEWAVTVAWAGLPDSPVQRFPHGGESLGAGPLAGGPLGLGATVLGDHGPWDPQGAAPRPESGRARGLLAGVRWSATWFTWETESDPRGELERWRARRFESNRRGEVEVWSDPWGGDSELRSSLRATNFGLMATALINVSRAGEYLLGVVSDDGVRISIDGEVVLEDWTWHSAQQSSSKINLDAGSHTLSLEYFQMDGPAVLTLELTAPSGN